MPGRIVSRQCMCAAGGAQLQFRVLFLKGFHFGKRRLLSFSWITDFSGPSHTPPDTTRLWVEG